MKKIYSIVLLSFLSILNMVAQDIQLTQFYCAPIYLNPAFTGANACSQVSMLYRNQWPGISNVYTTKMISWDHGLKHSNFGFGFTCAVDEAGAGTLRTTLFNPTVSYEARFNRETALRFGLQPGFGNKSVNYSNLTFGDQIYRGGNVSTVEKTPDKKFYFDLTAGALFVHSNYWAGISISHINVPNESFYENPFNTLPVKYSIHMGTKFELNKDEKDKKQKKYISPILHYRAQNKFDQVDVGFYYSKNIFTVGVWYRGIPVLKSYKPGDKNNDAFALIVGLQTNRMKIGYSYDKTISDLSSVSQGAHEVTLSFQLCNPKKRKTKLVLISCPKF